MKNLFKQITSQLLHFSRSDRNALLILSALIIIAIVANIIVRKFDRKPSYNLEEIERLVNEWEHKGFYTKVQSLFIFDPNTISENRLDSLLIPQFVKNNILNYRMAGGKFVQKEDLRKVYGMNDSIYLKLEEYIKITRSETPKKLIKVKKEKTIVGYIDPNTASFIEFKEFGFNNFQANNILSYRNKGGLFSLPADLQKIYGIDSIFFNRIKDNIKIEKRESGGSSKIKIPSVNIIELNKADSTELVKLSGIGPVYASRIIKYKNLLGGYCKKRQLLEVYNFPEETYNNILDQIYVDSTAINKIRINFVDFAALLKHPYLDKKQVAAILNYRDLNGRFNDVSQIQLVESIDSATYIKIRPYLTCR